jgi:polar amino acid transport system substrate-binding protein
MLQLTQNLKTGITQLNNVPLPACGAGDLLVKNFYSLISAGTESSIISVARKGYIGKALEKPEQFRQVIESVKREGIASTYTKVMNKLDSLSPLGYSSAGIVLAVGKDVQSFRPGDRVACGGAGLANHAEVISVHKNLVVKIPDTLSLKDAAYTTVASIAMQGVRQADLRIGENCAVIGLGLIGQITVQILKASGVNVVGIDISRKMTDFVRQSLLEAVFTIGEPQMEFALLNLCGGYGFDSVIITASSHTTEPVELAGKLCRQKGSVVVVGAVPTGFSRDTYYKKELQLKMSCSYGPGRYNSSYEEKGLDYPIGYVRWTENRNMYAVADLLAKHKINTDSLTTHLFEFSKATDAYTMIMKREEFFIGVLLQYSAEITKEEMVNKKSGLAVNNGKLNIGFIGAGSFAQSVLLPNLSGVNLRAVVTSSGHTAKNVADKFGFRLSGCTKEIVLEDKETDAVFIATRHNHHAQYVIEALKANKSVFVEKPLCLNKSEFDKICDAYNNSRGILLVGFNRRFAPFTKWIKENFHDNIPKVIMYRINAGYIPSEHWTQDPEIGGGRILGEVCHFIDLAIFLSSSRPYSVSAAALEDQANDTLTINIKFRNGSIASIVYLANGSKEMRKELLEVHSAGLSVVVDDFKEMRIFGKKLKTQKLISQDKGHKNEITGFLDAIKNNKSSPIAFEELCVTTQTTFDVMNSISQGKTILCEDKKLN